MTKLPTTRVMRCQMMPLYNYLKANPNKFLIDNIDLLLPKI